MRRYPNCMVEHERELVPMPRRDKSRLKRAKAFLIETPDGYDKTARPVYKQVRVLRLGQHSVEVEA